MIKKITILFLALTSITRLKAHNQDPPVIISRLNPNQVKLYKTLKNIAVCSQQEQSRFIDSTLVASIKTLYDKFIDTGKTISEKKTLQDIAQNLFKDSCLNEILKTFIDNQINHLAALAKKHKFRTLERAKTSKYQEKYNQDIKEQTSNPCFKSKNTNEASARFKPYSKIKPQFFKKKLPTLTFNHYTKPLHNIDKNTNSKSYSKKKQDQRLSIDFILNSDKSDLT